MKCVVQRVERASVVDLETKRTNSIDRGYCVYVGFHRDDGERVEEYSERFLRKLGQWQFWEDETGRLGKTIHDVQGSLLLIPNFTLYGRSKSGKGVDFCHAAGFEEARDWFDMLAVAARNDYEVQTGFFGEHMQIDSCADGPITFLREST